MTVPPANLKHLSPHIWWSQSASVEYERRLAGLHLHGMEMSQLIAAFTMAAVFALLFHLVYTKEQHISITPALKIIILKINSKKSLI